MAKFSGEVFCRATLLLRQMGCVLSPQKGVMNNLHQDCIRYRRLHCLDTDVFSLYDIVVTNFLDKRGTADKPWEISNQI